MPAEQVERYAAQIAAALAFAHEHGTIHGDLKGSNIVVTPEGNVKLLDFGLGRRIPRNGMAEVTSSCLPLAEVGATAGTLPYLAPEVLRGNPTSLQSDVWALGVLLYQMATGELPFLRRHALRTERGESWWAHRRNWSSCRSRCSPSCGVAWRKTPGCALSQVR